MNNGLEIIPFYNACKSPQLFLKDHRKKKYLLTVILLWLIIEDGDKFLEDILGSSVSKGFHDL